MANVLGPLHSGQATGSVEGLTYSPDDRGNNVRARITPIRSISHQASVNRNIAMQSCSYKFQNESQQILDIWYNYAATHTWHNKLGQPISLSPRQWYMRHCLTSYIYFPLAAAVLLGPPLDPLMPTFDIIWTASGASLSWSPELEDNYVIVVYQKRNLTDVQVRTKDLKQSHLLYYGSTSPTLVTGATFAANDPPGFPPIAPNTWINFRVKIVHISGWQSPAVTFRITNA